jgi:DNA polymerase-3 subunit epsilon
MRQIFLDTETTGLSASQGHRIVEIACVEWVDGVPSGRIFHHYVNPQRNVPAEAVAIHGLSNAFLAEQPLFIDLIPDLIEFVIHAELHIHNAPFDLDFLNHELRLAGIPTLFSAMCAKVTDTLPIFRHRFPGQSCSLQALCERQHIHLDAVGSQRHTALTDARQLARLWNGLVDGGV